MRKANLNLKWNVLLWGFNKKEVVDYNIIRKDLIEKIYKGVKKGDIKDIGELKECIKNWAMYHFWSRSEYEIMVGDLFCKEENMRKIDAYRQVLMNLDRLAEYINEEMQIFPKEKRNGRFKANNPR
jgi:hypothetical protein